MLLGLKVGTDRPVRQSISFLMWLT